MRLEEASRPRATSQPLSDGRIPRAAAGAGALLGAIVHGLTLCPTVYFLDAGELTAAAWSGGVSHPPGQPFWTALGWVWSHALPFGTPALRLNLLSLLATAAAGCLLGLVASRIARRIRPEPMARAAAAFTASAGYAVSGTAWLYATSTEVYALHGTFLAAMLHTSLVLVERGPSRLRAAVLGGLFTLSWSNHASIVLLGPGLFVLFLIAWRPVPTLRALPWCALGCAVGALPVIYLPLRASADPQLNWGDPDTAQRLVRHLTAWQYQSYAADYFKSFASGMSFYFKKVMWDDIPPWLLLLAPMGAIALHRATVPVAWLLSLAWLVGLIVPVGYGTTEQRPYFALIGIVVLLWTSVGMARVQAWIQQRLPGLAVGGLAVAAVSLIGFTSYRWSHKDKSRTVLARSLASELLNASPTKAVLMTADWELVYSPALYLQICEGIRRDVVLFDPLLFRRSWYADSFVRQLGPLPDALRARLAAYRAGVDRFEAGAAVDGQAMEQLYRSLIQDLLGEAVQQGRVVRATVEALEWLPQRPSRDGLAFRVPAESKQREEIPVWASELLTGGRPPDVFVLRVGLMLAETEKLYRQSGLFDASPTP